MTMIMCDNARCRFNNDRVCARAKMYCVGRMCQNARRDGYMEMMKRPSYGAKLRSKRASDSEWEIIKRFAKCLKDDPERAEKMVRELKELEN